MRISLFTQIQWPRQANNTSSQSQIYSFLYELIIINRKIEELQKSSRKENIHAFDTCHMLLAIICKSCHLMSFSLSHTHTLHVYGLMPELHVPVTKQFTSNNVIFDLIPVLLWYSHKIFPTLNEMEWCGAVWFGVYKPWFHVSQMISVIERHTTLP